MSKIPTQIGDVSYNAAAQRFEALVTFHTDQGRIRVASQYYAPLDADFDAATRGLMTNALSRLDEPASLKSRLVSRADEIRGRAPRHAAHRPQGGFDWLAWLHGRAA